MNRLLGAEGLATSLALELVGSQEIAHLGREEDFFFFKLLNEFYYFYRCTAIIAIKFEREI